MKNRSFRRLFGLVTILCAAAVAAACTKNAAFAPSAAPSRSAASEAYWPTDGWRTSAPEDQGMDAGKISRALERIAQEGWAFHSLLIVRNGYLVSETYFASHSESRLHAQYSCTKSVVSTLVGIAIDKGYIEGVEQPLTDLFPDLDYGNPDPRKERMTLEDVLTMRTGLDWPEDDPAFNALYRSTDWVRFMLSLPMAAAPGTTFNYCSGCSHLLSAAVQRTTGMATTAFAGRYLFEPLGIDDSSWETNPQGTAIGGWGLNLTPRDMAKLGYLYLREGLWDGTQIVSAAWVETATQKHADTGDTLLDYGYQWWIYPSLKAYTALGLYGQTIFVIPELDLIVVATAQLESHDPVFELIEDFIVPAVQT
jgi:CubicO group peptidase (beta-lactamase class C family)